MKCTENKIKFFVFTDCDIDSNALKQSNNTIIPNLWIPRCQNCVKEGEVHNEFYLAKRFQRGSTIGIYWQNWLHVWLWTPVQTTSNLSQQKTSIWQNEDLLSFSRLTGTGLLRSFQWKHLGESRDESWSNGNAHRRQGSQFHRWPLSKKGVNL